MERGIKPPPICCFPFAVAHDWTRPASARNPDFSRLVVAEFFGGVELAISQISGFNTGQLTMRAMLVVDVVATQPGAFVVASSIT